MNAMTIALAAAGLVAAGTAFAHGEKPHAAKPESRAISTQEEAFGREVDPKRAARMIRLDMSDRMRFDPTTIEVKRGEIVRFEVRNAGKTAHEMVLGTMQELKEHSELMRKHPRHGTRRAVHGARRPAGSSASCVLPAHSTSHSALRHGEIRKVDKEAKKITIRHQPMTHLEMPAMTMIFQVQDPALLEQVKVGDKVRFAAEKKDGAFVVTQFEADR